MASRSRNHRTSLHLPEELIIEILSWLPAQTLVRFRCVSRSWNLIITNHDFRLKHFSNASPNSILLKHLSTTNEYEYSFFTYPLDLSVPAFKISCPFDCYWPDESEESHFDIRGHSHGLVCLSDLYSGIYLWNPTTNDIRELPPTILIAETSLDSASNAVGFGYNSKTRDLEVVRVMWYADMAHFEVEYPPRVEIYDLSKNRWREIQTNVCGFVVWNPSFEMYYEGMYYWWAMDHEPDGSELEFIMSFDINEEVFRRIFAPESFEPDDGTYRSTGVLNGSMILFKYPKLGDERSIDIWKMEKISDEVSWTKLFTIDAVLGFQKPLLFVSSNELLMEASEGRVVLYNMNTQEVKDIQLEGNPPAKFIRAVVLVQSLFSVMGGNNINY